MEWVLIEKEKNGIKTEFLDCLGFGLIRCTYWDGESKIPISVIKISRNELVDLQTRLKQKL